MADRYRVELDWGHGYWLTAPEAESRFVDLRVEGVAVEGDLESGFTYVARRGFDGIALGQVRVIPVELKSGARAGARGTQ
jgi:hypothetical protein